MQEFVPIYDLVEIEHVTEVTIEFVDVSLMPSSFEYEIDGADKPVSGIGPGSETVTITGNVATSIWVRCKSYGNALDILAYAY